METHEQANPSQGQSIGVTVAIVAVLAAILVGVGFYLNKPRVRKQFRATTLVSDGRVIGNARSEYFIDLGGGWGMSGSQYEAIKQDAFQVGNAAQEYFLATGNSVANVGYDPATGAITGDLSPWLVEIGKGYTIGDLPIERNNPKAFSLKPPGYFGEKSLFFSDEGKTTVGQARNNL